MKVNLMSTTDYKQFKHISGNRPVDLVKVSQLKKLIAEGNFLPCRPILIDAENCIIDGQHRLAAAEALKLPIYYMQTETSGELSRKMMRVLNQGQSSWKLPDHVKAWAREGVEVYEWVLTQNKLYGLPVTTIIYWGHHGRTKGDPKGGTLEIPNQVREDITAFGKQFSKLSFKTGKNNGIKSLKWLSDKDGFDWNHLINKAKAHPEKFKKVFAYADIKGALVDFYNYRTPSTKKLIAEFDGRNIL